MKYNKTNTFAAFMAGFIIACGVLIFIMVSTNELNYKQGQIDAVNGKMRYALQTHSDGTKTWERISTKKPEWLK